MFLGNYILPDNKLAIVASDDGFMLVSIPVNKRYINHFVRNPCLSLIRSLAWEGERGNSG